MSGKEILVDTNIILYLLDGSDTLEQILQGKNLYLSFITELELLGFKNISSKEESQIVEVLNDCSILSINKLIKEKYVEIRRKYHLKLPDALIAATAIVYNMPLITADKQFKTVKELNLISYQHGINLT
ncbi:type II toxin-antitoxin system VapC family toxin [Mucilaginibacter segetis]|uniref:Type II toxin-antitoxin system VapC family toxin n=1 Tax=Mucilaginibacter segetis TaxID=2793071 RepID=A0A934PVD4_9SPHI|nr:type II toxin-antitoxin system VapC family toxin [Mucilaginibacter segetis]MBK0380759.1 type II toxin-antitoxin system VapC family toxin [Mucilaginibacter segetis]